MTFLLAISSFLSRMLGVYRNHALSQAFGATELSDTYFAAFQVPDTLYNLLVFGAISASFVPLYLQLRKKDDQQAQQFVASVMNGFLLFIVVVAGVAFLSANVLTEMLYPAFTPEMQDSTATLLRIMLLSPIFFTCSSIFSGIQNANRTFWGFAFAPILYNLGIIGGIELLVPVYGVNGVAYGVVAGAAAHAGVQFIPALRLGFRWKPVLHWSEEFKTLLVTAIPRILSMASFQLNFFIEGVIATLLMAGNLTILRYAQDIQSFPVGIIGVSIAISSFSVLSHFVIDEDYAGLSDYLRDKLEHVLMLMIPASFGLYILRYPLVSFILGGEIYDAAAVDLTAQTLSYLCIGLVAAAVMPLVNRVFFAFHDTARPFWVMVVTVLTNAFLAVWLSKTMGVAGIGLSSALTSSLSVIVLMIILRKTYFTGEQFFPLTKTAIFFVAGLLMNVVLEQFSGFYDPSAGKAILLAQMLVGVALGIGIYFTTTYLFLRKELIRLLATLGK